MFGIIPEMPFGFIPGLAFGFAGIPNEAGITDHVWDLAELLA